MKCTYRGSILPNDQKAGDQFECPVCGQTVYLQNSTVKPGFLLVRSHQIPDNINTKHYKHCFKGAL